MRRRAVTTLAAVLAVAAPTANGALAPYSQDFEALVQLDPAALSDDGWLVWGNVFDTDDSLLYWYGAPAPNDGRAFCAIDAGQGGVEQGAQQLSVYSDYENFDNATGNLIESNVYQEQVVGASDVGNVWTFQFDAKLGNLEPPTTAVGFIKTVDPYAGFTLSNFFKADMTSIPATWGTYSISIPVDASLVGQLMQFGFACTQTGYVGSGVFYDNLSWVQTGVVGVAGTPRPKLLELGLAEPNPFSGVMRISYSVAQRGPADLSIYDVTGRRVATLFHGQAEPGSHVATWDGRFAGGSLAPTGIYRCVLKTAGGLEARSVVLSR